MAAPYQDRAIPESLTMVDILEVVCVEMSWMKSYSLFQLQALASDIARPLAGQQGTELDLARIFRANEITGWRRVRRLSLRESGDGRPDTGERRMIRPDFVFRRLGLAVFVDGCYWHGCPQHATKPRTNAAFWRKKFAANKARDLLVNRTLRKAGWRVVRIWEHELERKHLPRTLRKLQSAGL